MAAEHIVYGFGDAVHAVVHTILPSIVLPSIANCSVVTLSIPRPTPATVQEIRATSPSSFGGAFRWRLAGNGIRGQAIKVGMNATAAYRTRNTNAIEPVENLHVEIAAVSTAANLNPGNHKHDLAQATKFAQVHEYKNEISMNSSAVRSLNCLTASREVFAISFRRTAKPLIFWAFAAPDTRRYLRRREQPLTDPSVAISRTTHGNG